MGTTSAYDRLRHQLEAGGRSAETYARRLRAALDRVDRIFGDAGTTDRTWLSRIFRLQTPAPLWTAAAYDRCLLLALLYPIGAIYVFWAIAGHVGVAERALLLPEDLEDWHRGLQTIGLGAITYGAWRGLREDGFKGWLWLGGAVAVAGAGAVAFAVAFAGAVAVAFAGAFAGAGAGACAVVFAVLWTNDYATRNGWQARFQAGLISVLSISCILAPGFLATTPGWPLAGAWLLFLGLLTLLNAPFDWASLGVTRALLRRGLERERLWPYVYGLVDAALAAVVIVALTIVCVLGAQAFETMALYAGGQKARILPLEALFVSIRADPAEPANWWVYAMLLSTMIPSLVNLAIGGASLLRGFPWITARVLAHMPERRAPAALHRQWMTLVLTMQVFLGILLGIAAQAVLAFIVIGVMLPVLGRNLLDIAEGVASLQLPARALSWFVPLGP